MDNRETCTRLDLVSKAYLGAFIAGAITAGATLMYNAIDNFSSIASVKRSYTVTRAFDDNENGKVDRIKSTSGVASPRGGAFVGVASVSVGDESFGDLARHHFPDLEIETPPF